MRRLGAGLAKAFVAGRLRRGAVVPAAAVLAAASLAAAAASAAAAAPGQQAASAAASSVCQVTYTVNSDWGTGFSVAVNITNNGPAITSWTLGYAYTGNQKIAQGWSGNWSQSGENITVTNASWNGSLATGGSASIRHADAGGVRDVAKCQRPPTG